MRRRSRMRNRKLYERSRERMDRVEARDRDRVAKPGRPITPERRNHVTHKLDINATKKKKDFTSFC